MSRDIPESIKRQLRQEAGFGCCICGNPIYDYQHILEWAVVKAHNPEDMLLLCPQHHRQATAHALSEAEQRQAKRDPFNIRAGSVNGLLYVNDHQIGIETGSVHLVGTVEMYIDGEQVFRLSEGEEGRLLISLRLYDTDGTLLIGIHENEWVTGDPLPWDFEFAFRKIVLRRRRGNIALSLDLTRFPGELRTQLMKNGRTIVAGRDDLIFNDGGGPVTLSNLALVNVRFLLDEWTHGVRTCPVDGQELMGLISWPDKDERFERAVRAYRQTAAQYDDSC